MTNSEEAAATTAAESTINHRKSLPKQTNKLNFYYSNYSSSVAKINQSLHYEKNKLKKKQKNTTMKDDKNMNIFVYHLSRIICESIPSFINKHMMNYHNSNHSNNKRKFRVSKSDIRGRRSNNNVKSNLDNRIFFVIKTLRGSVILITTVVFLIIMTLRSSFRLTSHHNLDSFSVVADNKKRRRRRQTTTTTTGTMTHPLTVGIKDRDFPRYHISIPTLSSSSITARLPLFTLESINREIPDFGNLELEHRRRRMIRRDPKDDESDDIILFGNNDDNDDKEDEEELYYVYPYHTPDYDTERHSSCRHVSWERLSYPNCNAFHEFSILDYSLVSQGGYMDVWLPLTDDNNPKTNTDTIALKTYQIIHPYDTLAYNKVHTDALITERLTSSPRIATSYGYCALSVVNEAFAYEVEEEMVPGLGYLTEEEAEEAAVATTNDDGAGKMIPSQNNLTISEKLTWALHMAESLADLHGFEHGVIVHDDVQPAQWLLTTEEKQQQHGLRQMMKLNDFNGAMILRFDEDKNEYCRFKNRWAHGQYRSPEEFRMDYLDEKIDVYSLGNNFYALLTGLWNFYLDDDEDSVRKRIINGEIPFIDKNYQKQGYGEKALIKIMKRCWAYDPKDRVDVFDVVKFLRKAVKKNSRLMREELKRGVVGSS